MDNLKAQWDDLNKQIDQLNSERNTLLVQCLDAGISVEDLLQPIEMTKGDKTENY